MQTMAETSEVSFSPAEILTLPSATQLSCGHLFSHSTRTVPHLLGSHDLPSRGAIVQVSGAPGWSQVYSVMDVRFVRD